MLPGSGDLGPVNTDLYCTPFSKCGLAVFPVIFGGGGGGGAIPLRTFFLEFAYLKKDSGDSYTGYLGVG